MELKLGIFIEGGTVEVRAAEEKSLIWLWILNKSNNADPMFPLLISLLNVCYVYPGMSGP